MYINGVLNSSRDSKDTIELIQSRILTEDIRNELHHSRSLTFKNVWNQSTVKTDGKVIAGIKDLSEAAYQAIGPDFPKFHSYALALAKNMRVTDKVIKKTLYNKYHELNSLTSSPAENDYLTLLGEIREQAIDKGDKVLLISHSQGNLFADQIRAGYVHQGCEDDKCSNYLFFRNLQLASPRGYSSSDHHDGIMFEDDILNTLYIYGISNGVSTHSLVSTGEEYSKPTFRGKLMALNVAMLFMPRNVAAAQSVVSAGKAHLVVNYLGVDGSRATDLEGNNELPVKDIFIDKVKKLVATYPSNCDETTYDVQSHQIDESIPGYNYKFTFKVNIDGDGNFLKTINGVNFIPEDNSGDIGLASFNTTEKKEYDVVLEGYFVKHRIEDNGLFLDIYLNRHERSKIINFSLSVKDAFDATSSVKYNGSANGCYEGYIEYKDEFGEYCIQCNTKLDSEGHCLRNVINENVNNSVYANTVCGDYGSETVYLKCFYEYECEGIPNSLYKGKIYAGYSSCSYDSNKGWFWDHSEAVSRKLDVTCDNKSYKTLTCNPIKPTKIYSE